MKENEFIKGKWYVSTNKVFNPKKSKLYIKFSMIRKGNIHYSECIQTWSDSPYRNYAESADPYLNFVVADMIEVSNFLPDEHPDKLVGLPEEYIVECINERQTSIVLNSNTKDCHNWLYWKYCIVSNIDRTGFNIYSYIPDNYKHFPILTFETWNKLKDMKEAYKYTREYCLNKGNKVVIRCESTAELKEVDKILGTNYSYFYSSRQLSHSFNVSDNCHASNNYYESDTSYDIIKAEDFIKNNTKNMKDKKIIEWRLKENCKQYAEAAFQLSGLMGTFQVCGHHIHSGIGNTSYTADILRKNNVLDLWFEPVYEEESINLSFGDTRVTVTKGQGFVSLQEGNISKTELKAIIDHFTKGPKMLGYEGKAEKVTYGCKSGLISELQTIYNTI